MLVGGQLALTVLQYAFNHARLFIVIQRIDRQEELRGWRCGVELVPGGDAVDVIANDSH